MSKRATMSISALGGLPAISVAHVTLALGSPAS